MLDKLQNYSTNTGSCHSSDLFFRASHIVWLITYTLPTQVLSSAHPLSSSHVVCKRMHAHICTHIHTPFPLSFSRQQYSILHLERGGNTQEHLMAPYDNSFSSTGGGDKKVIIGQIRNHDYSHIKWKHIKIFLPLKSGYGKCREKCS